jgi:hypothetical protein
MRRVPATGSMMARSTMYQNQLPSLLKVTRLSAERAWKPGGDRASGIVARTTRMNSRRGRGCGIARCMSTEVDHPEWAKRVAQHEFTRRRNCRGIETYWDNSFARSHSSAVLCHYNYCRRHSSLKGHTPARAHGLSTEVWSVGKMIETVTET